MSAAKWRSNVRSQKTRAKPRSHNRMLLHLQLPFQCPDNTRLVLENVRPHNTVSKIKIRMEQELGILPEMYYLSYLDSVPLEDNSKLQDHEVVDGGTLRVNVWRMWVELLKAAINGNIRDCFACSVNVTGESSWNKYTAWVALFVASHYGHHNLVAELLSKAGLAINSRSPCGWTALHAAARMGRWKVLCMLVDNGADVRILDNKGLSAFDLARDHSHKKCENSLNFCQWNLQKHRIVQERRLDYDAGNARRAAYRNAHQYLDSTLGVGFRGTQGQIYMMQMPNPVSMGMVDEFNRDTIPKSRIREELYTQTREEEMRCNDTGEKLDFDYGWFDGLRGQQLIPSTRCILKYSDPSSCQLRPRSILNPGGYKTTFYTAPSPIPPLRGSLKIPQHSLKTPEERFPTMTHSRCGRTPTFTSPRNEVRCPAGANSRQVKILEPTTAH